MLKSLPDVIKRASGRQPCNFIEETPPLWSGVLINFAILEPFLNKVAGLF